MDWGVALRGKQEWLPYACLVLAMALWGTSFIALKWAFQFYQPIFVLWGRMVVGSLCFLFLISRLRGNRYLPGDAKWLAFMVFCEPCLYFIFEALALENTSASQAGIIAALLPLLVAAGAYLFLGERVTKRTWTGFLLALIGIAGLNLGAQATGHAPNPIVGNLFEVAAMICATGYTLSLKRLSARYNPFFLTALQAFAGAVFFTILGVATRAPWPQEVKAPGLLAIVYLGCVVTLGAYGLYNFGVSRIPASQATGFTNLIPLFTLAFAVVLLGEWLTPAQFAASALILLGVLLSQDRPPNTEMALPGEN